jgi:hypothetical protein
MIMKNHFLLILLPLLLLQAGPSDASGGWFKVINVTPIEMTANSEANFTVSVKGMAGERAYVELVFRNMSEGFDFTCPNMTKNVFPAGVTDYNCSVRAADVAPGNYSFVVDAAAPGARPGKMTAYINVVEKEGQADTLYDSSVDYIKDMAGAGDSEPQEPAASDQPSPEAAEAPMLGAAGSILCLLIALRRMKR